METLAIQKAIERTEKQDEQIRKEYESDRDICRKEDELRAAIVRYETVCKSVGCVPDIERDTQAERHSTENTLQEKVVVLANTLLLSNGVMSPYSMDINAEIAHLYSKRNTLDTILKAEGDVHTAADAVVRAYDLSSQTTLEDHIETHTSDIQLLKSTIEDQQKEIRTYMILYFMLVVSYLYTEWMSTR